MKEEVGVIVIYDRRQLSFGMLFSKYLSFVSMTQAWAAGLTTDSEWSYLLIFIISYDCLFLLIIKWQLSMSGYFSPLLAMLYTWPNYFKGAVSVSFSLSSITPSLSNVRVHTFWYCCSKWRSLVLFST